MSALCRSAQPLPEKLASGRAVSFLRTFPLLRTFSLTFCLALVPFSASCGKGGQSATSGGASTSSPSVALGPDAPPPITSYRTTSGSIALGNLTGQIHSLEALAASDPKGDQRLRLTGLLLTRADHAGRIADLVRASQIAEDLPREVDSAEAYLTRAGTRAALHRFDSALSDLEAAERLGASARRLQLKRASIAQARGDLDAALALQRQAVSARRDITSLGALAVLLGELDKREEALSTFREALSIYDDTSPFPVAWLFFQQGLFWEREGRKDLALAYHQAAVDRVPTYAHAAAHLARLSPPERALSLLTPLAASSDDPEIEAVLADKLREKGDTASAQAHTAKAAARYDELVTLAPEAFSDHAAQFWLDTGHDANKALALARKNLDVRKTPRAYELCLLSALEAGDRKAACEFGTEGSKLPRATSMFREIAKGACEPR